jgi:uncharacterized protein YutE (UPF0331/DUF86 family)
MKDSDPSHEILCDIRQYLQDAEKIFNRKVRNDTDRRDFYARTMVIFALSNRFTDLSREVVYKTGIANPRDNLRNKVYYKRLNDYDLISLDMRENMIELVNFRNKISHHFFEISDAELEKIYESFPVYKEFVRIMEYTLSRKSLEKKAIIGLGIALITVILIGFWFFS